MTFDAQVHCRWTADAGHSLYVNEEFRDKQGRAQVRPVWKVRWVPATARSTTSSTTALARNARRCARPAEAGRAGSRRRTVPYDTGYLSGHVVEHYQVVLVDAAQRARASMDAQLMSLCGAQVPGDTYRNLRHRPRLLRPDLQAHPRAHLAVVVYVRPQDVSGRRQRLHRGARGALPQSPSKVLFAVLAVLVVIVAFIPLNR